MFLVKLYNKTQAYHFLLILLSAMLLGTAVGYSLGPKAVKLKPLGDIFLNLMYTLVIPLVFFSIASAIANISDLSRTWKILYSTFASFIFTSLTAAIFMLIIVKSFPLTHSTALNFTTAVQNQTISLAEKIVNILTVADFIKLFSRDNMLALIFFAILIGLATVRLGEKAKPFANLLQIGAEITMQAVAFIMYYAPIGFFAYFAVLAGTLGPQILATYFEVSLLYYLSALAYFGLGFSGYAYLAGGTLGLIKFWKNIALPSITALATCSSAASIPANLQASKKIGIRTQIYEIVVPLGAILHKDGSVLGGIVKIAFLFSVFNLNFATPLTILTALVIALLVGTVMGAIPGGGMLGEMLILSAYGFPPEALMIIAAISMLIDPPATMLNVSSNTACSMLVARLIEGKNWLKSPT